MEVALKVVKYKNLDHCLELSNKIVKLVITAGFGPRVLFYGRVDGQNMFHNFDDQLASVSDTEWKSYGGHRLWHAPEVPGRTYFPDCDPVEYEFKDGVLNLYCQPELPNSVQKAIEIRLDKDSSRVELVHRLTNIGSWEIEFSAWALSVMEKGGRCFVPQEDFIPHGAEPGCTFAPARPLVLWPFTKMNDARFTWGEKFIEMAQDDAANSKIKFGVLNTKGYAAYLLNGELFVKHFDCIDGETYPDFGCNCEFFTMPEFLEIESLSPLTLVAPGETVEHFEAWELYELDHADLKRVREKLEALA